MDRNKADYIVESFLALIHKYPSDVQDKIIERINQHQIKKKRDISVPVSIFSEKLGSLESIIKYLHEELNLSTKEISQILNRSHSSIITSYSKASQKVKTRLIVEDSVYKIPVKILTQKKYGVLESIVYFLKTEYCLHFSDISKLLKRKYQTIRTAFIKSNTKR